MKIKSRKEREKEYKKIYGNISTDIYDRLVNELGEDFNEDLLQSALKRISESRETLEYHMIRFTFYEEPIQTHRPRVNYYTRNMHVPNAKENHDAIGKFIKKLKKDIQVISTPMKVCLTAYCPMPTTLKPIEILLYETEHDYAIGKPDFDNVLKAYCDMIQQHIILDDDIISSASFNKYYSLKPRVELSIIYTNGYVSEYTYNKIKSRKSYQQLSDHIKSELIVMPYKKQKKKKKG